MMARFLVWFGLFAIVAALFPGAIDARGAPGGSIIIVASPELRPSYRATLLAAKGVYLPVGNASLQKIGGCRHKVTGAVYVQDAPDTEALNFTIELHMQNEVALMMRINQMHTPGHPEHLRFMNSSEFAAHHEHSPTQKLAIRRTLEQHGIHTKNVIGRLLFVNATVASINNFFHTKMAHYQTSEYNFTASPYDLQVPTGSGILGVLRLHNRPRKPRPMAQPNGPPVGNAPAGSFRPPGDNYHFLRTLYNASFYHDGSGMTVGVIGQAVAQSDVDQFEAGFMTAPAGDYVNVTVTNVPSNWETVSSDSAETTLDVEFLIAMAPHVIEVLVYMCDDTGVTCMAQAAQDNRISSMSTSWEAVDNYNPNPVSAQLLQFAAQGITFLTASGDAGCSEDLGSFYAVDPAMQTLVTSVGGTLLGGGWDPSGGRTDADVVITNTYPGEMSWASTGGFGSGGGLAIFDDFAMPAYQAEAVRGYGWSLPYTKSIPDVSAFSNAQSPLPYLTFYYSNGPGVLSGTSLAAPIWHGVVAILNQALGSNGRVGFINPILYAIAGNSDQYAAAFHDIADGANMVCENYFYPYYVQQTDIHYGTQTGYPDPGNVVFPSVRGYDAVTGLGTPNVGSLVPIFLSYVPSGLRHWLPLQGSTADYFDESIFDSPIVTVGGSSSCALFSQAGSISNAWTQSCGFGNNPAYLALADTSILQGDYTQCFAAYPDAWSSQLTTLISCQTSNQQGCVTIYYDRSNTYVSATFTTNGPFPGNGEGYYLPANTWFHFCITFTANGVGNTPQLGMYVDGLAIRNPMTIGGVSFGGAPVTPLLGGDGSGSNANFYGSFVNWRVYDVVLDGPSIAKIAAADTPSPYDAPGSGFVTPGQPSTPYESTLYFPLQGNYVDSINGETATVSGSSSCAQFASSSGPWEQSCTSDSSYATLVADFQESQDFSICFYANAASLAGTSNQPDNTFFLSCNDYTSGNVDCVQLYYYSPYSLLVVGLNYNQGHATSVNLNAGTWYHFCVVYSRSSATLLTYVNGNQVDSYSVSHTTSSYGSPNIPGYGDPIAYLNWRLYSSAISSQQVASLYVSDAPGGGSTSSPPSNPTPPPSSSNLLHWLPLTGGYTDEGSSNSVSAVVEGSSSCASFSSSSSVSNAWTQSCATSPAYLQISDSSVESSDFTICVAGYSTGWSQENSLLVFCEASGSSDCGEIRYDSTYSVLVFQLTSGGGGGYGTTLPANQWFHVCISYTTSSQTLSGYLNGNLVLSQNVGARASYSGVSPVLGGSSSSNAPFYGSFVNWRLYNAALSSSDIASIASSDAP